MKLIISVSTSATWLIFSADKTWCKNAAFVAFQEEFQIPVPARLPWSSCISLCLVSFMMIQTVIFHHRNLLSTNEPHSFTSDFSKYLEVFTSVFLLSLWHLSGLETFRNSDGAFLCAHLHTFLKKSSYLKIKAAKLCCDLWPVCHMIASTQRQTQTYIDL